MRRALLALVASGSLWSFAACRSQRQVVFVCEHGAAKSVVAAAYFNKLAAERRLPIRAIARGASPQRDLAASAITGLRADGLGPGLDAPRPLTAADVRAAAQVVVFDCDEPTMKALQGMDDCWGDVPAVGENYARARDIIRAHVEGLANRMTDAPEGNKANPAR